jgi:hypothetical protein
MCALEPQKAQLIEQGPGQPPVRQPAFEGGHGSRLLPGQRGVGGVGAPLQQLVVQRAVGAVALLHPQEHLRLDVLPDTRRGKHHMRADLDEVVHGRLAAFREVDGQARGEGHRDRHHLLANPGQRQETQVIVAGLQRIDLAQRLPHVQQIAVAEHRGLGKAGGAARQAEVAHVVGVAQRRLAPEHVRGVPPPPSPCPTG